VRADLRPFGRVERPLEQRAEDRRLDLGPVVLVGLDQFRDFAGDRSLPHRRTDRR
jgi:hypothetical protein